MIQTRKVLLGILIGAVVGTFLGALMAPSDKRMSRIWVGRESMERSGDADEEYGGYAIL